MAPTLNCTLGDPAANSYVCLDEAEEIAANIPGGDEWIALTEDEKVFSLIAATALLETLQYRGEGQPCHTFRCPFGKHLASSSVYLGEGLAPA